MFWIETRVTVLAALLEAPSRGARAAATRRRPSTVTRSRGPGLESRIVSARLRIGRLQVGDVSQGRERRAAPWRRCSTARPRRLVEREQADPDVLHDGLQVRAGPPRRAAAHLAEPGDDLLEQVASQAGERLARRSGRTASARSRRNRSNRRNRSRLRLVYVDVTDQRPRLRTDEQRRERTA